MGTLGIKCPYLGNAQEAAGDSVHVSVTSESTAKRSIVFKGSDNCSTGRVAAGMGAPRSFHGRASGSSPGARDEVAWPTHSHLPAEVSGRAGLQPSEVALQQQKDESNVPRSRERKPGPGDEVLPWPRAGTPSLQNPQHSQAKETPSCSGSREHTWEERWRSAMRGAPASAFPTGSPSGQSPRLSLN